MAQQQLLNGASGLAIRNAINSNFTELYARGGTLNVNPADYGVKADGIKLANVTTSSSSKTLTCATANFTAADVGKVYALTASENPHAPATSGAAYCGTIAAVVDSTTITLSQNAPITSSTAIFYYGTDDTVAMQAAYDAAQPLDKLDTGTWYNIIGGQISLPAGIIMITAQVNVRTNVSMEGKGPAATIFKWCSTGPIGNGASQHGMFSAEQGNGSTRTYKNVQLRNLTLDTRCAFVITYGYNNKAFVGIYMMRNNFENLHVLGSPATGIGIDYNWAGRYHNLYIENPGRLFTSGGGGGSGLDFQTSYNWAPTQVAMEATIITGCRILNPAVSGIRNTCNINTLSTSAAVIANNIIITNKTSGKGIEDNAYTGAVIANNVVKCTAVQTSGGTAIDQEQWHGIGSYGGNYGVITGNTINGYYYGVRLYRFKYNSSTLQANDYLVSQNNITNSVVEAVRIECDDTYTAQDIAIQGNKLSNIGGAGVTITNNGTGGTVNRITISDNVARDLGQSTANDAEKSMVYVKTATNRLRVYNNVADDANASGKTKYGVTVDGVAVTGAHIDGDDFSGVAGAQFNLINGGTLAGEISNCKGYRPAPAAATVGASPWTYTAGVTGENLYINGGTVSSVVKAGVTLATATNTVVRLRPNESVTITYSAAPTAVADKI